MEGFPNQARAASGAGEPGQAGRAAARTTGGVWALRCSRSANAFSVPALDSLVIGTQDLGQAPPGKEVPAADRVNECAAAYDAAQEVAVLGYEGQVAEDRVHAADATGGRHRRAQFGCRPAVGFCSFP
jgi:hypothetical protein